MSTVERRPGQTSLFCQFRFKVILNDALWTFGDMSNSSKNSGDSTEHRRNDRLPVHKLAT